MPPTPPPTIGIPILDSTHNSIAAILTHRRLRSDFSLRHGFGSANRLLQEYPVNTGIQLPVKRPSRSFVLQVLGHFTKDNCLRRNRQKLLPWSFLQLELPAKYSAMSKCDLHLAGLRLWPNSSRHRQPDHVRVPSIQEALADFPRTTLLLLILRRLIPSSQGGEDGF